MRIHNLVDSSVLQRVFKICVATSVGTGFIVEKNGKKYLVTARHLFEKLGYPNTTIIKVWRENGWEVIDNKIHYHADNIDIAVIETAYFDKLQFEEVVYEDESLLFSQELFMLGFPYNNESAFYDVNRGYPVSYIKKGILSGKYGKYLVVDWDNNQGFSGGPVAYRQIIGEGYSDIMYIAGVICAYIPHQIEVVDIKTKEVIGYTNENSGMGIICPIQFVMEVIESIR